MVERRPMRQPCPKMILGSGPRGAPGAILSQTSGARYTSLPSSICEAQERKISHEKCIETLRPNRKNGNVILSQRVCSHVRPREKIPSSLIFLLSSFSGATRGVNRQRLYRTKSAGKQDLKKRPTFAGVYRFRQPQSR